MQIRLTIPEELDEIARLYRTNHRETYRGLLSEQYFSRLTPDHAREKWEKFLEEPGNRLWTACVEGTLLGFAAGREDPELPDTWYLDVLHVAKAARGRGVGSALLRACGAYALASGYGKMSVCIVKGNERARRLYEALGAEHVLDFDDDFCGTVSHSEKWLWKDLRVFQSLAGGKDAALP